ncbi:uncharacterized protein LOC119583315 [Penaeus monodon]|uniref:uncharacterized protein LOC119583315 n=1 Tax=Penaeus monodon TaxID=6687 RepID=UPI0018A6E866|nr:uncharacterized protein LOC119583315 [Penaeus monodon]
MVRQDILSRAIHLQMTLQVKAMWISLTQPYTVASTCLPPHNLNIDDLEDLLGQLSHIFLLLGDFSGQHHLWDDTFDTPTHFQNQAGTFSNINLSAGSPGSQLDLTWHRTLTCKQPLSNTIRGEWHTSQWGEDMAP